MSLPTHRQAGFTLVEMIIALVLAGFLAVVVTSGLHLGIKSWEAVTEHQRTGGDAYVSQHAIRRILAEVRPERIRDINGVTQVAFYGTRDEVLFVAPINPFEGSEELYWVMLKVRENEDGLKVLVIHHQRFSSGDNFDDEVEVLQQDMDWQQQIDEMTASDDGIVIHEGGFENFSLEYLRMTKGEEPIWESEWQADPQLPGLIRVMFRDEPSGHWPELLVMPKVNAYGIKEIL